MGDYLAGLYTQATEIAEEAKNIGILLSAIAAYYLLRIGQDK